jgi:hypothetical protein
MTSFKIGDIIYNFNPEQEVTVETKRMYLVLKFSGLRYQVFNLMPFQDVGLSKILMVEYYLMDKYFSILK